MRKVELRMNEQEKYEVIKELVDHNGNKNRACKKLGLSRRQIDRLIIKYKEKGKSGFIHGNRSKKPVNALDKSISDDIILLYRHKYQDWNFNHFNEFLKKDENIHVSYDFIYRVLTNEGILSPKARKKTKREYAKQKLLKEHKINLAIDKATSTVVGAYFDKQESLNGYYHVFYQILTNYGIPYKFLTDNRTVFHYTLLNPDKRTSDKDVLTQYGYACRQLGVGLETTSVSQAKGLIERTNGTFQGRLVQELKLQGITTIEEANKYLLEVFVPYFNQRSAMDYHKFPSVFEESPSEQEINYRLAVLTPRKIDNGNSIKYQNKYYQPYLKNQVKCFSPKTECLVIKTFTGELLVTIDEQVLELKERKNIYLQ